MYFELTARQACTLFIKRQKDISLLRLRQFMFMVERDTLLATGQPLVNGTTVITRFGPQLDEIDESYLKNIPEGDSELSPADYYRISHISHYFSKDKYTQKELNRYLKSFPENSMWKSELNYIDILRANNINELQVKECIDEYEYYLSILKHITHKGVK